jgi:hypothetical protein
VTRDQGTVGELTAGRALAMVINSDSLSDDIDRDGGGHGGGDQWLILRSLVFHSGAGGAGGVKACVSWSM